MFAERVPARMALSALARLVAEARASGRELLDLTETNPTRVGLCYPVEEILAAFQDPGLLRYEPDPFGARAARERVAELHGVAPDRIVLTASTSEAYSWLFKLLCEPGDEVLVPQPSYPLFEWLASLDSVVVRRYPLRYHSGWSIDMHRLESAVSERTRAVIVVSPNNPTGSYLKIWEWEQLQRICLERGIALIADEVFWPYSLRDDPERAPSAVTAESALTFALQGLSKLAGMPQMKLGWIVLAGPSDLQRRARERLEWIADTFLSVGTPVQLALPALLCAGKTVRTQIAERLRMNLQTLHARLDGSAASVLHVEGGWSAIVRMPRTRSEEEWVSRLLAEGVITQPGFFYDFESEAFLVLSLLAEREVFDAGVERVTRNV